MDHAGTRTAATGRWRVSKRELSAKVSSSMIGWPVRHAVRASCVILALAAAAQAGPAATVGEVAIHDAWARASPGQIKTSAAYMTLEVAGDQVDRLIEARSPVAEQAALHTHVMEGGVAKMRPVEAVEISPGAATVLEPGGLHIMLMGLQEPLVEGGTLPLSLTFEHAGTVELEVPIRGLRGGGMDHGGHAGDKPATN
jgi:periplasmic copper chaperone A